MSIAQTMLDVGHVTKEQVADSNPQIVANTINSLRAEIGLLRERKPPNYHSTLEAVSRLNVVEREIAAVRSLLMRDR